MKRFTTPLALLIIFLFSYAVQGQELVSWQLKGSRSLPQLMGDYGPLVRFPVKLYKITYTTVDISGRVDTASGLIAYPELEDGVLPLLAYQHGTVDGKEDVPSNLAGGYQIAEIFGALGYFSVAPDFLGLGESRGFHPYVHADSEAWAAIDMLFAARAFAEEQGIQLNEQLFITGYSQGGHAAAALQREILENYGDDFTITASSPMSGPYSISGVMQDLILSDEEYFYPAYLPNTILSYNTVYGLYDDINSVLKEPFASLATEFRNGEIGLSELNSALLQALGDAFNGSFPGRMLQDSVVQNIQDNPDHPFNVALRDNDVFAWAPQAPTRLFYCQGDDQVPPRNSVVADSVMNKLGAPDVEAINLSDDLNHGDCVEPAIIRGALFFGQYQNIGTTGRGRIAGTPVAAYPNPVSKTLTVEAPAGTALELWDLHGRLLRRRSLNADRTEVDVTALPPGMYLLRLQTGQGSWSEKVVVK